jgi:hypothetical protein
MNAKVEALKAALAGLSTDMLKTTAREMSVNFEEGATLLFCFALGELEKRMPAVEYAAFVESL